LALLRRFDAEVVRAIEGDAAARYFAAFPTMLNPAVIEAATFAGRTLNRPDQRSP
jgi:hypothetical protein